MDKGDVEIDAEGDEFVDDNNNDENDDRMSIHYEQVRILSVLAPL